MSVDLASEVNPNPSLPVDESIDANVDNNTPEKIPEINGPKGPEPTRFGDWERKGRCVDF